MSGQIDILYTNIGRGHPFYLDGISQALVRSGKVGLVHSQLDVNDLSKGFSRFAWNMAGWLYTAGSSGTVIGALYKQIRAGNDYNRPSLGLRFLGRDIAKHYADSSNPVLVAHPSLVGILRERTQVIYQHGELVAPAESLVTGAKLVMVPTEEVAELFKQVGYGPESILVTGLYVEPFLARKAEELYAKRRDRIASGDKLTGGYFSSGAEPASHVTQLVDAAISALADGGNVILLARRGGRLAAMAEHRFRTLGMNTAQFDDTALLPHDLPSASIILFDNRRGEDALTCQLFERFDYIVAPSHERSNWSMGMGLPMFVLTPTIGPFAPLNLRMLTLRGVALPIDNSSAPMFGQFLKHTRDNGDLLMMSENGYGNHSVDGFEVAARFLSEQYGN